MPSAPAALLATLNAKRRTRGYVPVTGDPNAGPDPATATPDEVNAASDAWRLSHLEEIKALGARVGWNVVEDGTMMSPARAAQFFSKTDRRPVRRKGIAADGADISTPAAQAAHQAKLGNGDAGEGAYLEGLMAQQAGDPVASEWKPRPYRAGGTIARIPAPIAARKGKTWPAASAIDQTISEPSSIVGDKTGTRYATLAENAPEAITITPLRGMKPKRYANGGTAAVDPQGLAYQQELANARKALENEQRVQQGAQNTANKELAATVQTVQNTEDQKYAQLGVSRPADVAVASGAPGVSGSPLARAAVQTDEQMAQQAATRDRALGYAQSRVTGAEAAVSRVAAQSGGMAGSDGLEASMADRTAGSAAGDARRAAYAKHASAAAASGAGGGAKLPVGMVKDPDTGELITAEQARIRAAERGVVYDDVNRRFTTKRDQNARTDANGNVRRDDGVWVSKKGNELRAGVWTDPATGNTLVDKDTWQSPQGFKFHITNHDTGAGYWETPDGFVLGANGVWHNPVTGQQMIHGVIYSAQELSKNRSGGSSAAYNLDETAPVDESTTDYALTP